MTKKSKKVKKKFSSLINCEFDGGFVQLPREILYDTTIDAHTKLFLGKVLEYEKNPNKASVNWTKSRARKYFKDLSDYRIDRIYEQLEASGYMRRIKCYPQKYDGEFKTTNIEKDQIYEKYHNRIFWTVEIYFNPKKNKYFMENNNVNSKERNEAMLNKHLNNKKVTIAATTALTKESKTAAKITEEETIKLYYQLAMQKFKQSYYMDPSTIGNKFTIDTDISTTNYIRENVVALEETDDINELAEFCWDVIVKGKTYDNDTAFESYRYSEAGKKIASINIGGIKHIYNTYSLFDKHSSKLNINTANEYGVYLGKLLLVHCSMVIHNYIKHNFIESLPSYKELLGLFKTLESYPALLCLENTEEQYAVLDYFFTKNQEKYIKAE